MLQLFLTSPSLTLVPSLSSCSYKGMSWWGRTNVSASAKGTVTPCVEFPPAESHRGKAPWLGGFPGSWSGKWLPSIAMWTPSTSKMHQQSPQRKGKTFPKVQTRHFLSLSFLGGDLYDSMLSQLEKPPLNLFLGVRYCDTKFYMEHILHHLECFKWM